MEISSAIVACARSWKGTQFHHQGRLKKCASHKGGVDCLGLLIGVAQELRICLPDGTMLSDSDRRDYSHTPDTDALHRTLSALLEPVSLCEARPGDVALLCIAEMPQHLGIITDYHNGLGLVHAYAQARCVVEHALDEDWRAKTVAVYRIPLIIHN